MNSDLYLILFVATICLSGFCAVLLSSRVFNNRVAEETKLDIGLPAMIELESLVAQKRVELHLSDDATIEDFADALHIKEGYAVDNMEERARISDTHEDGFKYIDFLSSLTPVEKRFEFAHECGHVLNKHPLPNTKPQGRGKSYEDQVADYTAAAILMPKHKVKMMLDESCFAQKRPFQQKRIIAQMCKKFGVSETTAIRRIKEVNALREDV